ncbi:MAG: hypothetical protein FWG25_03490 [Promicromonosporaceae bacterium]|nr:hypothetical protein [Promicromonosporaceae bacterium]
MRFDLGQRPVNQIQTVTFDAYARWGAGAAINTAWMEPTDAARQHGWTGIGAHECKTRD